MDDFEIKKLQETISKDTKRNQEIFIVTNQSLAVIIFLLLVIIVMLW